MDERAFWRTYRPRTPQQQKAAQAIQALGLLDVLSAYDPLLIGTIPLDIDIADSDLDVACHVADLDGFVALGMRTYGHLPGFAWRRKKVRGVESAILRLQQDGMSIELFAQPVPVLHQWGVRHFLVEARLLAIAGDPLRRAVRAQKKAGVRTEPAFAALLGLPGEPYRQMWALSFAADTVLHRLLAIRGWC